jgi:hypothetical protein
MILSVSADVFVIISAINPIENDWIPTITSRIPTRNNGLLLIGIESKNFRIVRYINIPKPVKIPRSPKEPKKCKGLLINLVVNRTVIRSNIPFMNLDAPNFVLPNFLG